MLANGFPYDGHHQILGADHVATENDNFRVDQVDGVRESKSQSDRCLVHYFDGSRIALSCAIKNVRYAEMGDGGKLPPRFLLVETHNVGTGRVRFEATFSPARALERGVRIDGTVADLSGHAVPTLDRLPFEEDAQADAAFHDEEESAAMVLCAAQPAFGQNAAMFIGLKEDRQIDAFGQLSHQWERVPAEVHGGEFAFFVERPGIADADGDDALPLRWIEFRKQAENAVMQFLDVERLAEFEVLFPTVADIAQHVRQGETNAETLEIDADEVGRFRVPAEDFGAAPPLGRQLANLHQRAAMQQPAQGITDAGRV